MDDRRPPEIEMTLDGTFRAPPKPPILTRILIWAVIIAVIAGALSLAAFALWIALLILPVALGAAAVAWLTWRFQVWRARVSAGRQRGSGRDVWRG
jgi:hypothetical protein